MTSLLILFHCSHAIAQTNETGTLRGRVIDGSQGEPIAGIEVTLSWTAGLNSRESGTTTDSGGAYAFYELPLDNETPFTLSAVINGKTVERTGIALSTWTPEMVADLEYFDTSSDPTHIHVGRMTVVLPPTTDGGFVDVIEFLEIHNDSDKSYAVSDDQGRSVGFRIDVPAAAQQVSIQGNELKTVVEGSTILLTEPIKPTNTVMTLSYGVPASATIDLSRQVHYPVEEAIVLIGGSAFEMTSSGFAPGEPASIHGEQYAKLKRSSVAADTSLALSFKRGTGGPVSSVGSGVPGGSGGDFPIVPTALVVVLAIVAGTAIGLWIAQGRARETSVDEPVHAGERGARAGSALDASMLRDAEDVELAGLKELFLRSVADLDEQHRSGTLPTGIYHQLRNEQKYRLAQVMRQQDSK